MDFDLTDAQRLIRDLTREFAEREVAPRAAEIDRADEFPQTAPGTGWDVAGVQTTATPTPDGYVLSGTKRFITAALVCELAVVVATTDRTKGRDAIGLFLVEMGTPGFSRGGKEHLLG